MRTRTFIVMTLAASFIAALLGCSNIFGVFGAPAPNGTYDELVLLGQNESQAKRYNNALVYFDAAIAKNPAGSKARAYASDAVFLRDLVDIYVVYTVYQANMSGNWMQPVVTALNTPPTGKDLFSSSGTFSLMANYLNDRYGHSFAAGQCDAGILNTSVTHNVELICASLFLIMSEFLDSNGDKRYAQPGDMFYIDGSGNIAVNTNNFNIDAMTNSALIANGDFANLSYADLTNTVTLMHSMHDTLEEVMTAFKSIFSSVKRLDDLNGSVGRLGAAVPTTVFGMPFSLDVAGITNSFSSFTATVRSPVNSIAATLNSFHAVLTGVQAYPSNDVVYFSPSAWGSHSGGLKGAADSALLVMDSIAALGVPLAGLTDWTTLTNTIATNDMAAFSNFISNISTMSNVLTNIMNMLTNLTTNFSGF